MSPDSWLTTGLLVGLMGLLYGYELLPPVFVAGVALWITWAVQWDISKKVSDDEP